MNVSIRSQLVAGVVALGASAVVVAPIAQPNLLPATKNLASSVQLSAWANPIIAMGEVLADVNTDIFNQGFIPDTTVWPDTFYGLYLYAPLNLGIIPDSVNQASTGPLAGLVNNLSGYGWAGIKGASDLAGGLIDSAWNWPSSGVTAIQQLIAGNPTAAWATIQAGIIDPIKAGVNGLIGGVSYIIDNVIQNVNTFFSSFVKYVSQGLVDSVVNGTTYVFQSIGATFTQIVNELKASNFEGAWNTAVEGFLGRNGTLGQIEKLSLGVGITQTVEGEPTVTIASPRSVVTSELQRLGGSKSWEDGGITNDPYAPVGSAATVSAPAAVEAAPAPAAALKSAPAPAAAAAAEAPTADAPKAEAPKAEAPAAVAEAPAAEAPAAAPEAPATGGGNSAATSAPAGASATAGASDNGGAKRAHRAPNRGSKAAS